MMLSFLFALNSWKLQRLPSDVQFNCVFSAPIWSLTCCSILICSRMFQRQWAIKQMICVWRIKQNKKKLLVIFPIKNSKQEASPSFASIKSTKLRDESMRSFWNLWSLQFQFYVFWAWDAKFCFYHTGIEEYERRSLHGIICIFNDFFKKNIEVKI